MARRIMFVQLKTGYDIDRGPSWIGWVDFNRSWNTARFQGRELRRFQGFDSNFCDIDTGEDFWLSGPKRDRTDTRYGPATTVVEDDAREAYEAFLGGKPLPGREQGGPTPTRSTPIMPSRGRPATRIPTGSNPVRALTWSSEDAAPVTRPDFAVCSGFDQFGQPMRVAGTGMLARCLQHETDHLNGIVMEDHLTDQEKRTLRRMHRGVAGRYSLSWPTGEDVDPVD